MILGADIASVDGNTVDWQIAKQQVPLSFAILRCDYSTWEDPSFEHEWRRATTANLACGPYGFLVHPRHGHASVPSPTAQAQAMITALGKVPYLVGRDLPPTLDVEFPGDGAVETGLSTPQLIDRVLEAWQVLRDHFGIAPIIYTSGRVWHEDLHDVGAGPMTASPLWLAKYPLPAKHAAVRDAVTVDGLPWPPLPKPWINEGTGCWIHQYQGDAIQVPGFSSTVDLNRFNVPQHGETGPRMLWLQQQLGMAEASCTLDDETVAAIKVYQTKKGLSADGIVGPKTFAALCWEHASPATGN